MAEKNSAQGRWAVIIGDNYYPSERCLQGAVRDANMVERHLQEGATPIDVTLLTATTPSNPDSHRPVEQPYLWPTRRNVVAALRRIIRNANPGDLVYFHFSGHGSKVPSEDGSQDSIDGELALALFEDDEAGGSYLWGSSLVTALRKMVEKGCIVMLVLDCCFSGSMKRHEARDLGVRCIAYNPSIGAASSRLPEEYAADLDSSQRDSQLYRDWLVNPSGYTIFSACGPHEIASEIEVEGQERHGALTYFLLDSLRSLGARGVTVTNQSLYEHLRTVFHLRWPQQTPMCYGNRNYSFYGNLLAKPEAAQISTYRMCGGSLRLRAGHAHGICKGDEFSVYPLEVPEPAPALSEKPLMICLAENVHAFESDLIEIDSKEAAGQIPTNLMAKLLRSRSPRGTRVQLARNIGNRHEWKDAARDLHYLFLSIEDTDRPSDFNVIVSGCGEYQVVGALHNKITRLPTVPMNSERAIKKVLYILQHLATYRYFEGIDNQHPRSSLQDSFSLTPHPLAGEDGIYNITHGDAWQFTVENTSNQTLYITVFDFYPSWKIGNVALQSGGNDYFEVIPKNEEVNGKRTIRLCMEVPEFLRLNGEGRCKDIIKVFITNKPISYPWMVLPEMPLEASSLCEHASCADSSPTWVSELTGRDTKDGRDGMTDEWTTRNFTVHTYAMIRAPK
ncbi:caspase domain-containing protein [Hypoxylon rubiginosum]|uniref:Caspase domain-containing protein n=1 Tax=Hypoxylon rubiginosum TaxID=110542 RepID=A0ACB9YNK6_9PEZI|nr:caspase domain-containing protein [Hypoxylon rubiginosum]